MLKRLMSIPMALFIGMSALPAIAQQSTERSDYWHHGANWGWGHMIFGSVMMILFWGLIIVGVVIVVRWLMGGTSHQSGSSPARKPALNILEERFAKGEIDKEEFEERKRLLLD